LENSTGRLENGWAYTLPSEAQWNEFVADADLQGAVTSYQRAKRTSPEPVGSVRANQLACTTCAATSGSGVGEPKTRRCSGAEATKALPETGLAPTLSVQYRWLLQPQQRKPQAGFRCVLVKQP